MLTRRQKNSIRGFTAVLSSSVLLSAFLIYTNISNTSTPEPVVISDILEGAVAYADESENDTPQVTLAGNVLLETMYPMENAAVPTAEAAPTDVTVSYPDTTKIPAETSALSAPDILPVGTIGNLNEVTLLSEELESLRTAETTPLSPETSISPDAAGSTAPTQT